MGIKEEIITDRYAIYNADCMEVMKKMPDDKIHLSIYSPPFGGLYHYSSDDRDLSNSFDYDDFINHYRFIIKELFRITLPGRIAAVHCTEIPSGNTGHDHLVDLPGDIIRLHQKTGFNYIARHIIWKEPLWVRNRGMTKNLSHWTTVKDASFAGVASADYLLIFRKKGENKTPIEHPTGFEFYAGENAIPAEYEKYKNWTGDQKENRWSHMIWRRYASSIWDDVRIERVIPYMDCKEPDDEKHVHPLQLDVIDRCVMLRSNPDEIVFTPFMGVGSEVYSAVINGRKGIGVELKSSYYRQAAKNMESALVDNSYQSEQKKFDFEEEK